MILFLCLAPDVMGQSISDATDEYECLYEYQVKNDKGSSDATSTILQIGRNTATFSDYTAFQSDSAIACKASESEIKKPHWTSRHYKIHRVGQNQDLLEWKLSMETANDFSE